MWTKYQRGIVIIEILLQFLSYMKGVHVLDKTNEDAPLFPEFPKLKVQ